MKLPPIVETVRGIQRNLKFTNLIHEYYCFHDGRDSHWGDVSDASFSSVEEGTIVDTAPLDFLHGMIYRWRDVATDTFGTRNVA